MSRMVRAVFTLAAAVFAAGVATCWFGVDHEIAKIPPEVRASMADTDWVGAEWVFLSMMIEAGAVAILIIAFAFHAWARSRSNAPTSQSQRGV